MSATRERDLATTVAKTDPAKALILARKVSDPWFRCQALAAVARYSPRSDVEAISSEAVSAAALCEGVYKRVAVRAWPIRALSECGNIKQADGLLMRSLKDVYEIQQPVSRMDALELLWHAAWAPPLAGRAEALNELLRACAAASSWKVGRCMRDIVLVISGEDPARAAQIIASMPEGSYKRQAARGPVVQTSRGVRPFFW